MGDMPQRSAHTSALVAVAGCERFVESLLSGLKPFNLFCGLEKARGVRPCWRCAW